MKRRGLLLSGGGTKIAGHAGYLCSFADMNLEFDEVAGVSAGAVIAPFAASQMVAEHEELFKNVVPSMFWKKAPFNSKGRPTLFALWQILRGKSFLGDMSNLKKTIQKYFELHHSIALRDSGKKLYCEWVDVNNGDINITDHSLNTYPDFLNSIVKSASIPVMTDVERGADGGLRNHLPIKSMKKMNVDELTVIYSRPKNLSESIAHLPRPKNVFEMLTRTLSIMNFEISKNDQDAVRKYCNENNIILREFYMPSIMNGVYDTDKKRQSELFDYCRVEGLKELGYFDI